MKKFLLLSIVTIIIGFFVSANADQRIDRDSNNCHISPDANDADAEVDVPCTLFDSQVNRYVNADGVRVANGSLNAVLRVPMGDRRVNQPLIMPDSSADIFLVGADNTRPVGENYVTAANTDCDLVRSNYQANTDSDDQNQTEYSGNDWDMSIVWLGYSTTEGDVMPVFDINDIEFDYNDDGVVNLSDWSIYRQEFNNSQVGMWKVESNCRNAAAQ